MKTKLMKAFTLCLALMMCLCCAVPVSAAETADAVIQQDADCSLTIFKYNWTAAAKDGVWNEESFVSTGWQESYVEQVLGGDTGHALGNGETAYGYALKGVEFTILRVADIVTFTESSNDQHPDYNLTQVLYGFEKTASADLLAAIGLADGAGRYENADATDKLDAANYYYTSDALNKALTDALAENATTVKNALETYIAASDSATAMDLTNEYGKTKITGLDTGLYLCLETKTNESITSTTAPFFVSLPMTTVSGNEESESPEGGHQWNYDVVVYPKNETGIPTLEKQVRESAQDTGKNNGTEEITDGFAHNATGSAGDVMEYQILSGLPTITSQATALTTYSFYDTLSEGLSYNQEDGVKIQFFTDAACADPVTTWTQADGKFTVTYAEDGRHMTIDMTEAGLSEINGDTENVNGILYAGYSNYTMRITYTAAIHSDTTFSYGQEGNDNKVVLTWKRTSTDYYDTLIDDCHVYSFGIDLTKLFSDVDAETAAETGMYDHVKFKIYNATDKYWLTADLNAAEGKYYVNGHAENEEDGTVFTPVTLEGSQGHIQLLGCEEDEYVITEVETANGYTLLKEDIHVVITASDDASRPCDIYSQDVLGVLQNDPNFVSDGGLDLHLANIPQAQLAHNYMTASATVDGNAVTMLADEASANAQAPLTVINTKGFDLPQTGDYGTWMFTVGGIVLMAGALCVIVLVCRKKNTKR